jgi:shikimate dehydrogenase
MQVDGATRLVVIVGDPIAQVKSPAGMTQTLQDAGHNAVVVPVHVTAADLDGLLRGVDLARNLDGLIATVPHKFACYRHCASASPRARTLEAVNIMRRNPDGTWHGDMLDGLGFVGAVRAAGGEPAGQRALLVGAGGAGSAIGLGLLDAGAAFLAVHDADPVRRDALIGRLERVHPGRVGAGSPDPRGFGLVANATPAGIRPEDPLPVDVSGLEASTFAGCVITAPAVSPWIAAARERGCRTSVGIGMFQAQQQMMLGFLLGRDPA